MHFNEIAEAANSVLSDANLTSKVTQISVTHNIQTNTTSYTFWCSDIKAEGDSIVQAAARLSRSILLLSSHA